MTHKKHSDLPWSYNPIPMTGYYNIEQKNGYLIGRTNDEKDASFITHACNTHHPMIKVLKEFADVVEASMVHGDIDLPLWIAKVRHAVALTEGDQEEADFQQSIIDTEEDLV